MIELSPRISYLIQQKNLSTFICVKILKGTIQKRYTTYPSDLTFLGEMYLTKNVIAGLEKPKMTSVIDRDLYKITFVDSDRQEFANYFDSGLLDANVEVHTGFIDNATGLPEVNESFIIYKGKVADYKYHVETDVVGEIKASISCTNPMSDLDAINPYYTSKEFMKQIDPTDTCYNEIFNGSNKLVLYWGKDS